MKRFNVSTIPPVPRTAVEQRKLSKLTQGQVALGVAVVVVVIMALKTLLPLWLPLLLAAWFADLAQPVSSRLASWLKGKKRAASVVAVLLVVTALSPLLIILLSLAGDAARLVRKLLDSGSVESAFQALVATENGPQSLQTLLTEEPQRILNLVRDSGASAVGFASSIAGATISAVIGLVVFVMAFYVFLVDGPRIGRWLERNAPLTRAQCRGFAGAFYETGRGLIVGVGLAALIQGAIAGVGYLIVGLPHAFVLALLTAAAGLVPSLGSGIVWLPVSAVLALSGRVTDGVIVFAIGSVAGAADNFIRPALSRFGRLRVPTFVLFCAMLGGVVAFGASGIIIGPLFVRLAMEGLRLWRRRHAPLVLHPSESFRQK